MKWSSFQFYFTDHIQVPLPEGHRFPMQKYRMLHEALVREGVMSEAQLHEAPAADDSELLLAHTRDYVFGLKNNSLSERELRPIGLPWTPELLKRSYHAVGGMIAATESALVTGFSGLLAGGTHHAHADRGEGYCVYNDFAVATLRLLDLKKVKKILLLDLDVHQGNGNSSILGGHPDIFVLSLHGEKNYPFRKVPSHLDVALPAGCTDEEYLRALDLALEKVDYFGFDLLMYQAGVDVLKEDSLGTFAMSMGGIQKRDKRVFEFAKGKGLPVALGIGGGYAKPIDLTVEAHMNTFKVAREILN